VTDMLSDVIRELEVALRDPAMPAEVTDERRAWVLMDIAERAARGDAEALAVVERLKALARSDPAFAKLVELVTGHENSASSEKSARPLDRSGSAPRCASPQCRPR
jgi:hypothetical protein